MATSLVGTASTAGANDSFGNGELVATKFTAVASGNGDQFQLPVRAGSSFTGIKLGVYSHNSGTDRPNALLGSTSGSITDNSAGVKTLALSPAVTIASGTIYWLAVLITGGGWNCYDVSAANGGSHYNGGTSATFTDPYSVSGAFDDNSQSLAILLEDSGAGGGGATPRLLASIGAGK